MDLTFYEQSAFTVQNDAEALAVDIGSYTSPFSLGRIGKPSAALVSHIHPDHFSEENLTNLSCPIYTVQEVSEAILDQSIRRTVLAAGESLAIAGTGFSITATPSDHGPTITVENVGFVIRAAGKSIYFLGDMAVTTPPPSLAYDIVLVPVGNQGYVFCPEDAFTHIQTIDWHGLTIPIHYYNSKSDAESGKRFAELAKEFCQVQVVQIGETIGL